MTFKRKALSALTKPTSLRLARDLELPVKAAMSVDEVRDELAGSKKARLTKLVSADLERDELKAICEACGLDPVGKEKQVLVERILAAAGSGALWDGAGSDAACPRKVREPRRVDQISATQLGGSTRSTRGASRRTVVGSRSPRQPVSSAVARN